MGRIRYLSREHLEPSDRELLARPINLFRALANRPEVLRPYADLADWVRFRSGANPRRREYIILTVGVAARCRYEVSHHVKIAIDFGATDAELDKLFEWFASEDETTLADADLAAVKAARELAESGDLSDEMWVDLIDAVGRDEALDLVVIAAYYGMAVRLLNAMRIDNEEEFEPFARRFDDLMRVHSGS